MLDISPEKLMMLMAVGLVVLGPNKLPAAARGLAHGLTRARGLASSLTAPLTDAVSEPLTEMMAEPRQAIVDVVADLRATIADHPLAVPSPAPHAAPADPSLN